MNSAFIKHTLIHGEKGKTWLKEIPEIIKKYENEWSLHVLPPFALTYNYVAPAIQSNREKAVLRIGIPWEKDEFFNEINALKFFNGNGVPKLLKESIKYPVALLELITPGTPLSSINEEEKSLHILTTLMKKIWKTPEENNSFFTMERWIQSLQTYVKTNNETIPQTVAREGLLLFKELIATTDQVVLTHADLHHDNVLLSGENNRVAIDPKGIIADRLYDTTALIRNPYEKLKNMNNDQLDTLLKKRILILSKELDASPQRIYKWCLAQTILSGVWTVDYKEYSDFSLKIISSLKRIIL